MANNCEFTIRAEGNKEDLNELKGILNSEYFNGLRSISSPFILMNNGNTDVVEFVGYCATSVRLTFMSCEHGNYKQKISLNDWIKDFPGLNIEIISVEYGMQFAEHYIFTEGKLHKQENEQIDEIQMPSEEELQKYLISGVYTPEIRNVLKEFSEEIQDLPEDLRKLHFPYHVYITYPRFIEPDMEHETNGIYIPQFEL